MTSKPGKKTIAIHILPNISKSKSNQTIKFGQLRDSHPESSKFGQISEVVIQRCS